MFGRRKAVVPGGKKSRIISILRRINPGTIFIIVGVAAIAAAAVIWLYNDLEDRRAAESSQEKTEILLEIIRSNDAVNIETGSAGAAAGGDVAVIFVPGADAPNEGMISENMPDVDVPADVTTSYVVVQSEAYIGILSIPRFGLNLPVNVTWSYPKLRSTPCRYTGSIERNDLVIAAHSYRSHFGNINTMIYGDSVIFTDVEGREINYFVVTVETVKPTDARNVVTSPYDLTLFTCTYDSKARVVVRCNRVEEPEPEAPIPEEPEPEEPTPEESPGQADETGGAPGQADETGGAPAEEPGAAPGDGSAEAPAEGHEAPAAETAGEAAEERQPDGQTAETDETEDTDA